ncbi:hypothetical protein DSS3P8_117 [Roseobacter phage DSS3P8]|nr:hypothetical protein DSS3P8_117 [Roseobacter phage DSS3P8]
MRGPFRPDIIRVEEMADWHRAGADQLCPHCGCKYRDHQPVPGYEWLRKLCDGDLVKI